MINGEKASSCACKGIRHCGICAPHLLNSNGLLNINADSTYVYCTICRSISPLGEHNRTIVENFLALQSEFQCVCSSSFDSSFSIQGIYVRRNFVDAREESYLMDEIGQTNWVESQSGRFKQDFGPKANFNRKKLKCTTFTGLPEYSKFLIDRLYERTEDELSGLVGSFVPVELCNLRYEPSRAACIDSHIDDVWLWGDRIITCNLQANTFLTLKPSTQLTRPPCGNVLIPMERRSLLVLYGDARYKWMHSIERNHVLQTRCAITLRELSDEFKSPHQLGQLVQKLAFSFNGISVGTVEHFFNLKPLDSTTNKNNNLELNAQISHLHKPQLELKNLLIDFDSTEESFRKVGNYIAQWILKLDNLSTECLSVYSSKRELANVKYLRNNFDEYQILLHARIVNSKLEMSLTSKFLSVVYNLKKIIDSAEFREEKMGLVLDLNSSTESADNFKYSLSVNQLGLFYVHYLLGQVETQRSAESSWWLDENIHKTRLENLIDGYEKVITPSCTTTCKQKLNLFKYLTLFNVQNYLLQETNHLSNLDMITRLYEFFYLI